MSFCARAFRKFRPAAAAALLIEQELEGEDDPETARWLERIERAKALVDDSWFGISTADRERFRLFRHSLPELVNETLRRTGCLKMGSDCAVPVEHNREMLDFYRARLDEKFRGRYVIFGHIGDAHLHVNILPTKEESAQAAEILLEFARKAVELGGSVSAEHGLGKRKAHLLSIQFSPEEIEAMKAVKRRLDPAWILGRGTLFAETGSANWPPRSCALSRVFFPASRYARSCRSNCSLRFSPQRYPPSDPSLRTTRWHGTTMAAGFVAQARATARVAFGRPSARAISEYVRVAPNGIERNASHTRRWNAVATTSVGKSSRGFEPARWRTIARTHSECSPEPRRISA